MKSSIEQDETTAVTKAGGQTRKSAAGSAPQQPNPSDIIDKEVTGRTGQQYGAIDSQWADLTESDFLKSRSRQQRRSKPARERPAITRHGVDEQIRQFFRQK